MMGWGNHGSAPNPKALKECPHCEGKGFTEDYHNQEYQTCDCKAVIAYRRKSDICAATRDYRDAVKRLRALGVDLLSIQ